MLRIGTFGGASAFPLRVADELGFLKGAGVSVHISRTRDSGWLRDGLRGRSIDIAHLSPDNVIAWADSRPDIRAWMAGSNGPIALVARGVGDVASLRGQRIGVDSPRSGFAPILRRLLDLADIAIDDVELVSLGATRLRFEALEDGRIGATLLTLPWSRLAERSGAVILADHAAVAPTLLTSCAASLDEWLGVNAALARTYADAIDSALAWLRDQADREVANRLFAEHMDLEPAVAAEVVATMLTDPAGWPARSRLAGPELEATWRIRAETIGRPSDAAASFVHVLDS